MFEFQSTLPVGGATSELDATGLQYNISIHAPRGGSDATILIAFVHSAYFNPRSPWGERQVFGRQTALNWSFQSTLPVGGATRGV